MLTITGGKLTTWRRMAKQVVDRMVEREGRVAPCRTDDIPLGMAASEHELDPPEGVAEESPAAGYRELLGVPLRPRRAQRPRACSPSAPSSAAPIVDGQPDLLAEVVDRGAPRAGPLGRRRPLAPHAARPAGGAAAAHRRVGRRGRRGPRRRARLGRGPHRRRSGAWPEAAAAEGIDPASPEQRPAAGSSAAPGPAPTCDPTAKSYRYAAATDGDRTERPPPSRPSRARRRRRHLRLPAAAPRGADRAARFRAVRAVRASLAAAAGGEDGDPRASPPPGRRAPRLSAAEESDSAPADEPDADADTDEMVVLEAKVLDDSVDDVEEADEDLPTEDVAGVLELTRQRYGFLRLEGLAPPTATSTSPPPRCAAASCAPATRSPARPASRAAASATARSSTSTPSTARSRRATRAPSSTRLPAIQPERRIPLDGPSADVLVRAVDLLAPLAYGQRILVRAAARSGRTTLLRSLARAAAEPDTARVIVLLIDERPEEATAWREALPVAEFAIATADLAPVEQVRTAELALERARRLAESGTDAILICDSLSRLAFAAGDVAEVKRLFGSGRNLAGGGSLTVLATVLEDGPDEGEAERAVITTESSLIALDPELAAAGVIPALRAGRVPDLERGPDPRGRGARGGAPAALAARRPRSRPTPPRCCASGSRTTAVERRAARQICRAPAASAGRRARTRTARARARSAPSRDPAGRSRSCGCRRRRRCRARPP